MGAYAAPAALLLARLTASQVALCSRCVIPRAFASQRPCCDARPPPRGVHTLKNTIKNITKTCKAQKMRQTSRNKYKTPTYYTWCDWVCQVHARCCVIAHRSRSEACPRRPPRSWCGVHARGVSPLKYNKKHNENLQSTKHETNIKKQIQNSDILLTGSAPQIYMYSPQRRFWSFSLNQFFGRFLVVFAPFSHRTEGARKRERERESQGCGPPGREGSGPLPPLI